MPRLPPPQFRGFDPLGSFEVYQRHLPHWRQPGATYFVTFRLADSLPQNVVDYIHRLRQEMVRLGSSPAVKDLREQYERDVIQKFESALDEGCGECILRNPEYAQLVHASLQHGQTRKYFLGCSVVMANHCHLVIRPNENVELEQILGAIKGYTAREINQRRGRSGPLWEEESYDRIVRDEEHLYRVIQYIGRNPTKCGLPASDAFLWIHPEWKTAGWDFDNS